MLILFLSSQLWSWLIKKIDKDQINDDGGDCERDENYNDHDRNEAGDLTSDYSLACIDQKPLISPEMIVMITSPMIDVMITQAKTIVMITLSMINAMMMNVLKF